MATERRVLTTHERNAALEKWRLLVSKVHTTPSSTSVLNHLASDLSSVPASLTPTSTSTSTSTSDINDILQVANEIEKEDHDVSLYLCEHAYQLSQNLDPNSKGRGVLQFKTGLMSHIKQKGGTRMKDRAYLDKKYQTLRHFYVQYHEKHRDELEADPPADSEGLKDRGIRRQKVVMTLRVLLEAIKYDKPTGEVEKEMNRIAEYVGASRDNILPLEGPSRSKLLELPEVIAAREALEATKLEIVYDGEKQRHEGEDIFDALEAAFGFQHDNLRNQREHLVLLLANTQSQQCDKNMPLVDKRDLRETIEKVCNKILENYKNWCLYVRHDCKYDRAMEDHKKVALVALYLCIWGEAANVRFLPECICYIYHNMAMELLEMLEKSKIHSSQSCGRGSRGPSFLEEIIIPVYEALKAEARKSNGGKAAHSKWRNYDDFNEFFWSNACFNQLNGWPLKKVVKTLPFFNCKTRGEQKTSFVEHRTFLHLYHSFVRVWILLVVMLQALVIMAFTNSFSLGTLKILLSLGPTYFVMKFIESVLDIVLMVGAYFNSRGDAIIRIFTQFLFYGGCMGGLSYLYWKMYFEAVPSDLFYRIFLWVLGSYVALKLLISLFQHIPLVRKQVEKMNKYRAAEALTWLYKEHFYVGRGLIERPRDHIRYVMFWVIVLACKFTFSYFFQIKPLANATKMIFFYEGNSYVWHDFVSKNNHNALTLFFLWAPVVLIYLLDIQIWYTIFSAILGGVLGAKDRLGEIRTLDMLRYRFNSFPAFFIKNLQHERRPNVRRTVHNEEFQKQQRLQKQIEDAHIYAPFWNDIILCLREEDYITDFEKNLLIMPTKENSMTFVEWPLFLLASKVFLAINLVVEKKEDPEEILKRLEKDEYMSLAVGEAFESVHNLLVNMVVAERGKIFFQKVYNDVKESIRKDPVYFFTEFFLLIDDIENIHKKVTDLTNLLIAKDKQPQDHIGKAVQNIYDAVLHILPQDLKREHYKDYLNDSARVLFININPPSEEKKDSMWRMHLLLTTKESGSSVPKNGEARRRLEFFTNSLFMRMPHAPSVRAMKSFRQLAEGGDTGSWYAQMIQLLTRCGWDIDHLPPLQYDSQAPQTQLSHGERNRVMREDLLQRYMRQTWITPHQPLPTKMLYYRDCFMSISEDGFIQRPGYMDTYMPHSARVAIGQLRVSSHQLEIETGRAARIPRAERICRLCQEEVESEEHYVCRCRAYSGIRERYTPIFSGHPSLRQIMESADQRRVGQFLVETQRYRETLLQSQDTVRRGRQSQLTEFFQRSTPASSLTQEGVTLQRAMDLRARRRPRAPGYWTPRLHQGEITEIRVRHRRHIQERLAHLHSHPEIMLQGIFTSPSPMYQILHPHYGTGWS